MRRRRGPLAMIVAALVLVLTACAGLPTGGGVNPGLKDADDAGLPDISFVPDRPQPGATQQEIVEGFLKAGSGPAGDWAIARLYLAPSFRGTWNPRAGVTVDIPADRVPTAIGDDAVSLRLTPRATVDADGTYAIASDDGPTTLPFTLVRQDDQWRIAQAPDGVVLDETVFSSVYHAYSLMYFDPTWTFLVPDLRWFPTTNPAASIAAALVDGKPSPVLAASVVSAFPENVTLATQAVPVSAGVAAVDLKETVLGVEQTTLDRMQTQLEASLETASVSTVQMTYAGTALTATAIQLPSTNVSPLALVIDKRGLGFLSGTELQPVPGISDAVDKLLPAAGSVELSSDQSFAAVRLQSGVVGRAQADRKWIELDGRAGLITPAVDPRGFIWSVPTDAPTALIAFAPGGAAAPVSGWTSATGITAMQLSRDGTRIAAIVTAGGRSVVWLAGVVRDTATGVPKSLSQPVVLATLDGEGIDIAWLDDTTLGVAARSGSDAEVLEQPVGGPGSTTSAPVGVTDISGSNQNSSARLRDSDGTLYSRRGTNWGESATGVMVLGTQQ